jgi:hypothetical protein
MIAGVTNIATNTTRSIPASMIRFLDIPTLPINFPGKDIYIAGYEK